MADVFVCGLALIAGCTLIVMWFKAGDGE